MSLLTAAGVSVSFGARTLFSEVNFRIEPGDKIGFVGANGTGKTTLLKLIIGELQPDTGGFSRTSGLRLGYLEQHTCADSDATAMEEALTVFSALSAMERQLDEINETLSAAPTSELLSRQAELNEQFTKNGGLTYKSRTRSALLGLGLREEELSLPTRALSGGQKSKIGLAKLLLCDPQLILLDEPTNHLDIPSVEWLENYLLSSPAAVLMISHDRYFLDKVTNKTFELKNERLYCDNGNYSRHIQLEKERQLSIEREYENTLKEIHRIEGIIEKQRTFSMERNYRTIDHKQKSIDRLKAGLVAPDKMLKSVHFEFTPDSDSGNDVLFAENLKMTFPDGKTLFDNVTLDIKRAEHVFLLGANGSGKTTLLRTLKSDDNVRLGARVTLGYFDQLQADLTPEKTVLSEVWDAYPHLYETTVRNALAAFLFFGDDVFKKIETLSGGERARVALCKLMLSGNNLLLLDEPTNHLDLRSREALEEALLGFGGTLIVVSHDRYFINRLATKILWLENGTLTEYKGNYDEFLLKRQPETPTQAVKKTMGAGGAEYHQRKKRQSAINKLKTEIKKAEAAIEKTDRELEALSKQLEDPEISADYDKVLSISKDLDDKKALADRLMTQWAELNEDLEAAEKEDERTE